MKLIRVTLRNGEVRYQSPDLALSGLWRMWQADGSVIGDNWCARFVEISHADLVDAPGPGVPKSPESAQPPAIPGLPTGILGKFMS